MTGNYKWTIILLVQTIEDKHNRSFYEMVNGQLMNIQGSELIKLVLIVNKNNTIDEKRVSSVRTYEISWDKESSKYIKNKVMNFGNVKLDDEGTLEYIFNCALLNSKADKYMLIVWGHGMGFGFFDGAFDPDDFKELDLTSKENVKETFEKYIQILNKNSAFDPNEELKEGDTKLLTPEHLSAALAASIGKVEMIVTMCCCMQNLNTAYALKNNTDYLVGAETLMLYTGYNYKDVLNFLIYQLEENKEVDSELVARRWITSLKDLYNTTELVDAYGDTNVSVIDLKIIDDFSKKLEDFLILLFIHNNISMNQYLTTRNNCEDVSNTTNEKIFLYLIDIKFWLEGLKENIKDENLQNKLKELIDLLSNAILENYEGERLKFKESFLGLSMYYPATLNQYYSDYYYVFTKKDTPFTTLFCKDLQWGNILEYILLNPKLSEVQLALDITSK